VIFSKCDFRGCSKTWYIYLYLYFFCFSVEFQKFSIPSEICVSNHVPWGLPVCQVGWTNGSRGQSELSLVYLTIPSVRVLLLNTFTPVKSANIPLQSIEALLGFHLVPFLVSGLSGSWDECWCYVSQMMNEEQKTKSYKE